MNTNNFRWDFEDTTNNTFSTLQVNPGFQLF